MAKVNVDYTQSVQAIISNDPLRWRLLHRVHDLGLPDCWVAAGFVRNAVWDHLHGRDISPLITDVDEGFSAAGDQQKLAG